MRRDYHNVTHHVNKHSVLYNIICNTTYIYDLAGL